MTLTPIDLQGEDFARMVELVETYADFPLGTTDAAVIALAERRDLTEVATLDHRPFAVVRPRHASAFTLLPWATTSVARPEELRPRYRPGAN